MGLLEIKDLAFDAGGKRIHDGFSMVIEPSEVHASPGQTEPAKTPSLISSWVGGMRADIG